MFALLKQTPPTPDGVCPDQVRADIKAIYIKNGRVPHMAALMLLLKSFKD